MMIGLTRLDLMDIAYQLAEINQLDNSFNREKKSASKHLVLRLHETAPRVAVTSGRGDVYRKGERLQ